MVACNFDKILTIGVAKGAKAAGSPPKCLEDIVIFLFERRFFKQNSVIRLKSNILPPQIFLPPKKLWSSCATDLN